MAAANPSTSDDFLDPALDHFTLFGLERGYEQDRGRIEAAYLELSRRVHPDRFAAADPGTRLRAMESTSQLNEAYRTLKDRVRRAEYLCKLAGIDVDSSDADAGAPAMNPEFLMEMIERREHLGEVRAAGEAAVEDLREEVEDEASAALRRAAGHLANGEARAAARELVVRRYLQRLLDEIDGNAHD